MARIFKTDIEAEGKVSGQTLASTQSSGDEGGQIDLAIPATNTSLSGSVAIDIYQNKLRIFETGGTNRGAYIDLTAASAGVASNLLAGGGGGGAASDSFKTISVSGQSDVVADSSTDTLNLIAGTNVSITTNATSDSITINSSGSLVSIDTITYPDYIVFDTTPENTSASVGTLAWDTGESNLSLQLTANSNIGIGQELIVLCNNGEATTLNKGEVVRLAGAQGQRPLILRAYNTNDNGSALTVGVVNESIAAGAEGFVVTQGIVRDINTNGFNEGDTLYLSSSAGVLTNIKPSAPEHLVVVGVVAKKNAASGRIYVKPINGFELDELHNVSIDGTPADNELLAYSSASGLWINQTADEADLVTKSTNQTIAGAKTFSGSGSITMTYPNILDDASGNTRLGTEALLSLTSGHSNVAIGQQSLTSNNSGYNNVAIGLGALLSSNSNNGAANGNVAIGKYSLQTKVIGSGNIAIGTTSLRYLDGASGNIAIGDNSGLSLISGDYNVIIGGNSGSTISGTSNNIILSDGQGNIQGQYLSASTGWILGTIKSGTWNGSVIGPSYGGTGLSSYSVGDIIYASASTTLSKLAAGTNGHVLTLAAGIPSWAALPNSFSTIATTSGTSPVADSTSDTLNLSAGTGITITGDASTDTITIASTITDTNTTYTFASGTTNGAFSVTPLGGSAQSVSIFGLGTAAYTASTAYATNAFTTISTTSGTSPVADSTSDTLTLSAGSGISVTGDSTTDTITIANTGYYSGGTDVPLADGGTNASLTASNGGIVYSTATAMAILSGTATAGQMLRSGASGAPSWSTATFPSTATSAGTILRADGTNWVASTATFPNTATTANTFLRADGTNWVASSQTLQLSGNTVIGSSTNTVSLLTSGNTSVTLPTSGTLAINPTTTIGDIIYASLGGTPGTLQRLAGNTATQTAFLASTGNGTANTTTSFISSTGTAGSNVVLATSPTITTPTVVTSLSTSTTGIFSLINTNTTAVNFAGSASAISIGAATGTTTINNASTVVTGDLAVNGGDITSTSASVTLFNTTATTMNIGGAATTVNVGASAGLFTVRGKADIIYDTDANSGAYGIVYAGSASPTSPAVGDLWIDDSGSNNGTNIIRWRALATAGQTVISGTDTSGTGLQYTAGYEQVYVNGVLMYRGSDYTATDGTSITFTTALVLNDTIEVISPQFVTFADYYTQGQVDTKLSASGWSTWSPVLSGGWANGNGTWEARYTQIGKTVFCTGVFTLGSTTTKGSIMKVSLPVTAFSASSVISQNIYCATTSTTGFAPMTAIYDTTTTVQLGAVNASGTYAAIASVNTTIPITWATGSILYMSFVYEAA